MRKNLLVVLLLFLSIQSMAQENVPTKYDPNELFNPLFYKEYGSTFRTGNGEPGGAYWQNKADYSIKAELNDQTNEVKGSVVLTYTNNSPHQHNFLWFQLDQNLFNPSSRGYSKLPVNGRSRYTGVSSEINGGYKISAVKILSTVNGKVNEVDVQPEITDTRMRVDLPKTLKSGGDKVIVKVEFSFVIPEYGADRTGILKNADGNIFAVAQWYPRICVFDDIQGWNTLPYLGASEFYLEYGNFDVAITAPANHVVVASGDLLNPSEVMTSEQLKRYQLAHTSDATVIIRSNAEVKDPSSRPAKKTLTWKYSITNARDFAWASSASFIWDAARINLPSGKTA
ncbi:MAG: hypothetical protein RLY11_1053, partial [Bacteroidota bacterium]